MVTTAPVTIEQAAAILGVSASTIRRRIRAGTLRVEETRRPQGVVWLVHLPPGTAAAETATADTGPVTTTTTAPTTPAADAMAALIQATLVPIVAPLVAEQAALRQTVERQAEQLVESAERRGRMASELEQAKDALGELGRRHDQTVAYVRWLLITIAVLALVVTTLTIAAVLVPSWVR